MLLQFVNIPFHFTHMYIAARAFRQLTTHQGFDCIKLVLPGLHLKQFHDIVSHVKGLIVMKFFWNSETMVSKIRRTMHLIHLDDFHFCLLQPLVALAQGVAGRSLSRAHSLFSYIRVTISSQIKLDNLALLAYPFRGFIAMRTL